MPTTAYIRGPYVLAPITCVYKDPHEELIRETMDWESGIVEAAHIADVFL